MGIEYEAVFGVGFKIVIKPIEEIVENNSKYDDVSDYFEQLLNNTDYEYKCVGDFIGGDYDDFEHYVFIQKPNLHTDVFLFYLKDVLT